MAQNIGRMSSANRISIIFSIRKHLPVFFWGFLGAEIQNLQGKTRSKISCFYPPCGVHQGPVNRPIGPTTTQGLSQSTRKPNTAAQTPGICEVTGPTTQPLLGRFVGRWGGAVSLVQCSMGDIMNPHAGNLLSNHIPPYWAAIWSINPLPGKTDTGNPRSIKKKIHWNPLSSSVIISNNQ